MIYMIPVRVVTIINQDICVRTDVSAQLDTWLKSTSVDVCKSETNWGHGVILCR